MTSAPPATSATTWSRPSWRTDAGRALATLAAALVALLVIASCSAAAPSGPAPAGSTAGPDPAAYEGTLWPQRPVIDLAYDVAPDLRTVTGRQSVLFTPDLPTCEVVLRAWPNNPTMSTSGSSLVVDGARLDGRPVAPRVESAGAPPGAPGTLVSLGVPGCLRPGQSVRADLAFTLTLGPGADERVGTDPATRTAWFGSGFLLPAWERGRGWAREPAVPMNGETATSEDAALTLAVTAPADLAVTGVGRPEGAAPAGPDRTVHRFSAPAVRDVSVGVGAYRVDESDVEGVRLHLATPAAGTRADPQRWREEVAGALRALTPVFGPFPYPDLWVTVTPGQSDGTEFPTALQFGDVRDRTLPGLVTHELGHQWFYSLVGNDQARDPWIDESFATFGETVAGTSSYSLDDVDGDARGRMGASMAEWAAGDGFGAYSAATYDQGAAVLAEARRRVGPERFDAALRDYVRANAHRVAAPADVARAFAGMPEVIDLLTRAGALPARP